MAHLPYVGSEVVDVPKRYAVGCPIWKEVNDFGVRLQAGALIVTADGHLTAI